MSTGEATPQEGRWRAILREGSLPELSEWVIVADNEVVCRFMAKAADGLIARRERAERAAPIVRAVNAHDELLAALRDAPILSRYHTARGFETELFIADYEAWRFAAREAIDRAEGR